jgi:hypothetical protein
MYIIKRSFDGPILATAHTWDEAVRIKQEHPGSKIWDNHRPPCPPCQYNTGESCHEACALGACPAL